MAKDKSHGGEKWWVTQQHDECLVTSSKERPPDEVKAGDRKKAVHGPFRTKEAAQQRADFIYSRTLRGQNEGR